MLAPLLPFVVSATHAPETPKAGVLEAIRAKHNLPSIMAGAIVDGRVVSLEAVGVRRLGSEERVTVDDPYHCGSVTKSFTAALFAKLVEEGKADWNAPLDELLPDLAKTMHPAYRKVTPLHLMAHRSGLSADSWRPKVPPRLWDWTGEPPSPRAEFAKAVLAVPPDNASEGKMVYTNAGYVVLGAIMERLTSIPWESLMRTRLLGPLRLSSAGFGPTDPKRTRSQPWGHKMQEGKLTPVPPGPDADNRPVMGPAATLHMNGRDMLRWCAFQIDAGRKGGPLGPESFRVLHHAPFGGDYAGGLIVAPRDWAGGTAYTHTGNNTMNCETLWIAPAKRFGMVVATNAYYEGIEDVHEEVIRLLIDRYCPK